MQFSFDRGKLEIDIGAYRLRKNGVKKRVTPTEWKLLRELLINKNQVMSHQTLLRKVWSERHEDAIDFIHTYISRLRRIIEDDPKNPQYIITESAIGYWFNQDSLDGDDYVEETQKPQPSSAARLINTLPQVVDTARFVGRDAEKRDLQRLILENTPLILVSGRGGIGKTALVSRILLDILQEKQPVVQGIVALSAGKNGTGINLPRIITDLSRLMNRQPEEPEIGERAKTQDMIIALLERLGNRKYILLLDNMESLQDPITGEIQDPDLLLFLEMAILQGSGLQIIMTGREQITLPALIQTHNRRRDLNKGLTPDESIELLRRCDPDNIAGLRDADPAKLRVLAEITGGYPRALEVVAGWLQNEPLQTVESIIEDNRTLQGSVQEILVQKALDRLSPEAFQVMQIVAAFNLPISQKDVTALAHHFFPPGTDLKGILERLIKTFFLNADPTTRTLTLHPIDREYSYGCIPVTDQAAFNRRAIHLRIAEHYQALQPTEDSREHIPLYRSEIDHLILAEDYETAAQRLLWLDEKHLSPGAYYGDLKRLYETLLPYIHLPTLKRHVLLRLASACRLTGQLHDAEQYTRQAQHAAKEANDYLGVGQALEMLGWVYYDLGIFGTVRDYWKSAINLYETDSGQYDGFIANTRGGMGWVSYLLGEYGQAEENFRQALTICRRLKDERGEALNLGDLGMVKIALGDYSGAIEDLEYAFKMAEYYGLVRESSYKGSYLATAYLLAGDLEKALDITRIISQHEDVPINLAIVWTIHGVLLTRLNAYDEARMAFQNAIQQADVILKSTLGLYQVRYAHALSLAGLSLLTHDEALRQHAIEDYETALSICNTAGVIQRQKSLLDALCLTEGGTWLESVQTILRSV